ncbi:hypothetical protein SAMN04487911_11022 [Arenibacter nanhaiticus]|uniref:YD repeat-containing protein n=1 Tax=Arenibacter nanhaiticus TaxID=558155 RepID=A0A1M6G4D2_9FLAO|nr:hypothetical protein [Arenibacter nanhaiticus]SHJ04754.1 hypothetical protein SAMN04487911_11022 [Arenibacter nanhaiticus]
MEKKIVTAIFCALLSVGTLFFAPVAMAQELEVFTVKDFDLKGPVQSCMVITSYGKEEYVFNKQGYLIKSVTRYNESDYDITIYKLQGNSVLEKRLENYRDGQFVKNTSIANFYKTDTTDVKKVTERIFSYDKEFLDQYEYVYNEAGKLKTIKRMNDSGIDETTVTYEEKNGAFTKTFYLNDVILKTVTTATIKASNKKEQKKVHTKEYLEGEPHLAFEQIYSNNGALLYEKKEVYREEQNGFVPLESKFYTYDANNVLVSVKTKKGKAESVKNYIYQFDSGEKGNWIRQVITPDNTYISRKIKYFENEGVKSKK